MCQDKHQQQNLFMLIPSSISKRRRDPSLTEDIVLALGEFDGTLAQFQSILTQEITDRETAIDTHTHLEADITDLDKYTKTEVDNIASTKAALVHNHNTLYNTKAEITSFLANKANLIHNHNDLYNTKTEIINSLATKADLNHNHTGVYQPVRKLCYFNRRKIKFICNTSNGNYRNICSNYL